MLNVTNVTITAMAKQLLMQCYQPINYYIYADVDILHSLEAEGVLKFTPSRESRNGARITCYDDRFILKCAKEEDAIVVSNDHFKDIASEEPCYRETIDHRLLGYIFANDW